jgi:hypothetical protein
LALAPMIPLNMKDGFGCVHVLVFNLAPVML